MKKLKSISEITAEKVLETGSKPILVEASDLNSYICKHTNESVGNLLFNEYIANRFLKIWGIHVPKSVLVDINPNHIMNETVNKLGATDFKKTCIGFEYYKYALHLSDMEKGLINNKNDLSKIKNINDLFKLLLFDIWLANEDRSCNNYNLLLNPTEKGNIIIPIDHEYIFNSNMLQKGLYQINDYDTIIHASLYKALIMKQTKSQIVKLTENICDQFEENVVNCKRNIENIFSFIPTNWNINEKQYKKLLGIIFTKEWIRESKNTYRKIVHLSLK